jgi:EmrB/QacA subfamily drug resistance transporter
MDSLQNNIQKGVSKKVVLVVVTIAAFLSPFMLSSINIALPPIGREFAMDAVQLAWVPTSYLLSATVFLLPFGRIADIYGMKRIFTYGIVIYVISSLLAAISTSATMLILSRIPQGIGGAMILCSGVAIIASTYPVEELGRALGINVAATYLGLSLGPFLGGLLTEYFGWRSVFLITLPLGLLIITLVLWKLKGEWAESKGEKFDLSNSVIYGIAIVTIMYGLSILPEMLGLVVILIGLIGFVVFVWRETKAANPILNMNLFKNNRVFAFSNLAALISYSATYAVTYLLSLYLQYTKGFSAQTAGMVLLSMPAVQAIFSPLAGKLSDRIAPQILASLGMALTTLGLILLTFLGLNTAIGFIVVCLIILGFGFAFFSSPNTNAVMGSVESKTYGVASATLSTMRSVGMMLSMGIAMVMSTIYVGRVEITPEYYSAFVAGMKVAFIIFAVLCFLGIFASLARGKSKKISLQP